MLPFDIKTIIGSEKLYQKTLSQYLTLALVKSENKNRSNKGNIFQAIIIYILMSMKLKGVTISLFTV